MTREEIIAQAAHGKYAWVSGKPYRIDQVDPDRKAWCIDLIDHGLIPYHFVERITDTRQSREVAVVVVGEWISNDEV
jgi:hypothetical protein